MGNKSQLSVHYGFLSKGFTFPTIPNLMETYIKENGMHRNLETWAEDWNCIF